jgi:hypothetical protein
VGLRAGLPSRWTDAQKGVFDSAVDSVANSQGGESGMRYGECCRRGWLPISSQGTAEVTTALAELQSWHPNVSPANLAAGGCHDRSNTNTTISPSRLNGWDTLRAGVYSLDPLRNTGDKRVKPSMAGIKTIIGLSFVRCLGRISAVGGARVLTVYSAGPRDRLPPRHPLRCAVQELPHAASCRNLRNRAITELAMWTGGEP